VAERNAREAMDHLNAEMTSHNTVAKLLPVAKMPSEITSLALMPEPWVD
jgi:hypothetical protein